MDRFTAFFPRLLPPVETFIAGRRACKGCGKALAARITAKAAQDKIMPGNNAMAAHCVGAPTYSPLSSEKDFHYFHDEILAAAQRTAKQSAACNTLMTKPVITINRTVFEKDHLAFCSTFSSAYKALYVCLDNESYLADFIERVAPPQFIINESAHSVSDKDTADIVRKKNYFLESIEEFFSYIATACPGYPFDLIEKVRRGLACKGNAFILVLTPCPTGWIFPPRLTQKVGRAAVHTGYFPLWEKEHGRFRLTYIPEKLKPLPHYIALQKRFLPLTDKVITCLQTAVQQQYNDLLQHSAQTH